jgi:hypothetical protein
MCKPENWKKHKEAPVFSGEDEVLGVGHCSFVNLQTKQKIGLYIHTITEKENGWGDRCVHTQPSASMMRLCRFW